MRRAPLILAALFAVTMVPLAEPVEPLPFQCAECGRGFSSRRKLRRHACS